MPLPPEIRASWISNLPGILAALDIADFKSLNDALSHRVGDLLIEDVTHALAQISSIKNGVARLGGGTWLLLLEPEQLLILKGFLIGFQRTTVVSFGWHGVAKVKSQLIEAEGTSTTRVTASLKCLYAHVESPTALDEMIDQLPKECFGFIPGRAVSIDELVRIKRTHWKSVHHEAEKLHCPQCEGIGFDWIEGDGSSYGAEGVCKGCGAQVEFRNFTSDA